jgi:hypothetical protein
MASNSTDTPWWTFPRIDDFGTIDPAGPYWKPDSNIQIPPYYPVVNLLPGTVTSEQITPWGQHVVTVKLDSPINNLATHEFYEHMSSDDVQVGEHLAQGDLVGYNNAGAPPLGYGFYSGDVYGSGSAWTVLQNDLAPGGAGLLNPTSLLNQYAQSWNGVYISNTTPTTPTTPSTPIDMLGKLPIWGSKIGLFVVALLLVLFGGYMLFKHQVDNVVKKGIDVAEKAVIA